MLDRKSSVFVTGHRGMVGSSLCRWLKGQGFERVIGVPRSEMDLLNTQKVNHFFESNQIDFVVHTAAKVGGVQTARAYPVDFVYENVTSTLNVFKAAEKTGVKKVMFLSSGCVYSPGTPQPMREDSILTGPLEPSVDGVALAKIVGLKMTEFYQRQMGRSYISVIPSNLYGPGDQFAPEFSHVIPGLMLRFYKAIELKQPEVSVWGTGNAVRDFLFVDDLSEALLLMLESYNESTPINISTGRGCTIRELAETMSEIMGYKGKVVFDASKGDGMPKKVLDGSRVEAYGWKATTDLRQGLQKMYHWAREAGIFEKYS